MGSSLSEADWFDFDDKDVSGGGGRGEGRGGREEGRRHDLGGFSIAVWGVFRSFISPLFSLPSPSGGGQGALRNHPSFPIPLPPLQVVGKVRSGTGFALMGKLQPYNPVAMAAAAALDLPAQRLFGLMYAASAQIEGAAGR